MDLYEESLKRKIAKLEKSINELRDIGAETYSISLRRTARFVLVDTLETYQRIKNHKVR